MKKKTALLLILLMFGVIIAGCINQQTSSTPSTNPTSTATQTTSPLKETATAQPTSTTQVPTDTEKPKYPITITDFADRKVTIEKEPQKIVSLAPSITETLYFLGALDKVVGVTQYDDFPPGVQEGRTVIGGFSNPNIEIIASLKPDLVIATSMHMKYLDQLEQIAPVIIIDPKNMDDIYKAIELLGKVVNKEEQAQKVIADMKSKVEEIQNAVKNKSKVRVFYVVWNNPLMTAGKGTFIDDLIKLAGGENIFSDVEGWAQVSVEQVLAKDPEVIILTPHCGMTVQDIYNSELSKTTAAKEGKVVVIQNDNVLVRPSPRIVQGLEELAKAIHPDAFGGKYPLTVVDFMNRTVTIEKEPQRIVSLAPSITETLFYIGAGDKVVGVTKYDDFPPQVANITKIGGFSDPNVEIIASLKPDLIIGTSMHIKYLDQLQQIAPVIIVAPRNIDEIYKQIELLGKVTNREEYAQSVVNDMKAKVEYITSMVKDKPKPKVFFISWWNPIYTPGKDTFQGDLIKLAGGENLFNDLTGWAQVSIEQVLARNPEIIILSAHAGISPEQLCEAELAKTDAVKNGRVYVISDDNIISRPGPRIVLGLEELAEFIHPEVFNYEPQPLKCSATASG
ncbi:ABC transporter substrate-binding protein [Thermococcus paralvinellae]|uniref:Vitamin B12 ABC transporter, B12-binding component n=1 Tax=Thermococcus paralvinellae TaxID=582419 RepID=W0I6I6_9EURY|nr:ABC transporter substrate-binding protein [Thermococcus paralvinellae]AHF80352.1 vitamin B12 ABC transporter, B12-binding component [Thermococcus paralvinellae]